MATAVRDDAAQETLSGNLCWLLSRAAQSLTTQFSDGLTELGVSPRAHCVLSTAVGGDYTQTALAQAVGLDKTTMVVTIDELEAAGLAERRPAEGDRRARIVRVTEAGERKVAQAEQVVARIQAEVLASLPAGERELLVHALARLVDERLAAPTPCGGSVRRR
jgi:MarR family transcriptional regulator, transcriptional regulator for hemolysin